MKLCHTIFVSTVAALSTATTPPSAIQVLLLTEATKALDSQYPPWNHLAIDVLQALQAAVPIRWGLSAFSDKPVPFRGTGQYGNYQNGPQDFCYQLLRPFREDEISSSNFSPKSLKALLKESMAPGLDENQGLLEGLIAASYLEKWDPQAPKRVILVLTGNEAHRTGAVATGRLQWNLERAYSDGFEGESNGGFGAHNFPTFPGKPLNVSDAADDHAYQELANLYRVLDAFEAGATHEGLNATEQKRFETLVNKFGPSVLPQPKTHPGDASIDCAATEYPGPTAVGKALFQANIQPFFLVTQAVYTSYQFLLPQFGIGNLPLRQLPDQYNPADKLTVAHQIAEWIVSTLQNETQPTALSEDSPFADITTELAESADTELSGTTVQDLESSDPTTVAESSSETSTETVSESRSESISESLSTSSSETSSSGTPSTLTTEAISQESGSKRNVGAIIGASVGSVGGLALVVLGVRWYRGSQVPMSDLAVEEESVSMPRQSTSRVPLVYGNV
eukprot:Protomagalhaensia_sp_Gyna_25__5591@NODE_770_length_2648_cov_333_727865_g605_i0_p1_GENE_NODE_770_length_2648_cov_333_727865_g605_i0NODE_770_length_2648_cov_333_727865_g605_i0_p1_ORF_typecomplete_len508_score52_81Integrin_beta/PF00362_18/0_035Integrin_beta/PF00362_18/0_024MGC24/PF05283_11/0_02Mucin15/PF15672_5/0_055Podoplanin/PF05808_11/16Alpha_GJ/PF03229_13/5_3e03Alpha_GJ/PF03229_13/0_55_NODE_770_length_2648_cov_333_727865_g605_i01641687